MAVRKVPTVALGATCITFSVVAYRALGSPSHVRYWFHPDKRILALQSIAPNDPDAYPVHIRHYAPQVAFKAMRDDLRITAWGRHTAYPDGSFLLIPLEEAARS